jgi:hypothetical protein
MTRFRRGVRIVLDVEGKIVKMTSVTFSSFNQRSGSAAPRT